MTKSAFLSLCASMPGAQTDQPFEGDFVSTIARHGDSRKWFAACLQWNGRDIVNLKCDMLRGEFWRGQFTGVVPGYHMNKIHWNTVYFDSDVPDDLLKQMTMASFRLTEARKRRI